MSKQKDENYLEEGSIFTIAFLPTDKQGSCNHCQVRLFNMKTQPGDNHNLRLCPK